jgi:hypothetical protein
MAPKNLFVAVIFATLLAWNAVSAADQYRASEFLGLDLSSAALSPKPLGPASGFTSVPAQTEADHSGAEAQARLEPKAEPHAVVRSASIVHMRAVRPRGSARTKLARRHTNPLDAEAFDTRIQVWPCKSGGICDWKRSRN